MDQSEPDPAGPAAPQVVTWRAWLIVFLSGLAGLLFYLDRQTLSVLKTTLGSELGWTDLEYSWLVSGFMGTYTLCYLFSGLVIDRWGTRRTMPVFIGLMSAATIACGLAGRWTSMLAFRMVLGVAEAGVVPAVLVAIVAWFPVSRRGTAAALREPVNIAGQIIAAPLAVALTQVWGWPSAFYVPGVFGLGVAAAWWWADRPRTVSPVTAPRPSWSAILGRREIRGLVAARMVSDPLWFFLMYWEPGYLQEQLGLSLRDLGRLGWIPTAVATLALILAGLGSDRLIARRGWSAARSRRVILQAMALLAPALVILQMTTNVALVLGLLCVVRVMTIVWMNFSILFMADLVPAPMTATAVALMSAFGAAMGLLCNTFVGHVVGAVGYKAIFIVGAFLHPVAALILWRCYGESSRGSTATIEGAEPAWAGSGPPQPAGMKRP